MLAFKPNAHFSRYVANLGSGLGVVVKSSTLRPEKWMVELVWSHFSFPWYPEGFLNQFNTPIEAMVAAEEYVPAYIRTLVDYGLEALKVVPQPFSIAAQIVGFEGNREIEAVGAGTGKVTELRVKPDTTRYSLQLELPNNQVISVQVSLEDFENHVAPLIPVYCVPKV